MHIKENKEISSLKHGCQIRIREIQTQDKSFKDMKTATFMDKKNHVQRLQQPSTFMHQIKQNIKQGSSWK